MQAGEIKLYRVEHPFTGLGPYWHRPNWKWRKHYDNPSAYRDGLFDVLYAREPEYHESDWRYAFNSLQQLRAWFRDCEIAELFRHGFVLAVYAAGEKDVLSSNHQAIWRDGACRLLGYHDLRAAYAKQPRYHREV